MKFHDLLIKVIENSEIPLRFEPGADDAVAKPIMDLLHAWIAAHEPADAGGKALVSELLAELDGAIDLPE